jgi:hypothetical protein
MEVTADAKKIGKLTGPKPEAATDTNSKMSIIV